MKDTPITNEYIHLINESIATLENYFEYENEPFVCMYPKEESDELFALNHKVSHINVDDIKQEFIDTLENYSKIFFQKKLFEFKFETLLSWRFNYSSKIEEEQMHYKKIFGEYTDHQVTFNVDVRSTEFYILKSQFINLCFRITRLKYKVQKMLAEFETIGKLYVESANLSLIATQTEETFQKSMAHTLTEVKIASKHKTDVIKILSAMYDSKMFVNADGKPQSNKEKMMVAFGEFLGEDFNSYSTLLSQAKKNGVETFMKPLQDLEKAFKKYLNFTVDK